MECPLWRLLISSRSISKHGYHMQFLFLKNLLLWNCLAIWTETWKEASTCMEDSALSFLKAEWKVSFFIVNIFLKVFQIICLLAFVTMNTSNHKTCISLNLLFSHSSCLCDFFSKFNFRKTFVYSSLYTGI